MRTPRAIDTDDGWERVIKKPTMSNHYDSIILPRVGDKTEIFFEGHLLPTTFWTWLTKLPVQRYFAKKNKKNKTDSLH